MGEIKGEFTGTWIPAHIMLDESLSCSGKILYATIASFNECFMLNKRLAELVGTSERTIQRLLKELKAKNYVQEVSKKGQNRVLFAVRDLTEEPRQIVTPPTTNCHPYNKYNNKTNNNISSNDSAKSDDLATLFDELRTTLKLSPQYKLSIKRRETLKRRLKEFSAEDIVQACRNLALDGWNMGENPQRKKYADVDFLLKSYEQVEKWLLAGVELEDDKYSMERLEASKKKLLEGLVYADEV